MNDLRVEVYGANEVAAKKQSMSKRVAMVSGAVVLTLGLFGLVGCVEEQSPSDEEPYPIVDEQVPPDEEFYDFPLILGGSGSWFVSVLERV